MNQTSSFMLLQILWQFCQNFLELPSRFTPPSLHFLEVNVLSINIYFQYFTLNAPSSDCNAFSPLSKKREKYKCFFQISNFIKHFLIFSSLQHKQCPLFCLEFSFLLLLVNSNLFCHVLLFLLFNLMHVFFQKIL